MGLLLDFYAGDGATIGAALDAHDHEGLQDGSKAIAHADFSLHIGVEHLDTLSQVIAERTNQPPRMFLDSLRADVQDGESHGATIVDPAWVAMVAALEPAAARDVSATWIRRV